MQKPEINALTLASVILAGVIAVLAATIGEVRLSAQGFGWAITIAGLTLLLVLFAFDRQGYRTFWQSLAFSAVCGYCVMLAAAMFVDGQTIPASSINVPMGLLIWAGSLVIFSGVDRVRMGSRAERVSFKPSAAEPTSPTPVLVKPAVQPEPEEPVSFASPPPASQPSPPQASQPPTPPQAIAVPPGVGKPTTIYLNLVGEGMTLLRSVQAEHLGRDFYRIVEPMPEGEAWEFLPGQVVRCVKKKLSTGKALVAFEEAPRAS
jgi:hypothetical protein